MNKKHYLVYKTTNLVNEKIYIGKHETDNLDDGYLGSGKLLRKAIEKYGEQNFKREILFECSTREEMNAKEAELVNEEFLNRKDVYNLKQGGDGGWDFINESRKDKRVMRKMAQSIGRKMKLKWQEHPEKFKNMRKIDPMAFKGKHHSEETKEILRVKSRSRMLTDKNVMRRSIWIYNVETLESKLWSKTIEIPVGWTRGKVPPKKIDETRPSHFRCWINNGTESKFVLKSEQEKFLSEGWKPGRLSFTS